MARHTHHRKKTAKRGGGNRSAAEYRTGLIVRLGLLGVVTAILIFVTVGTFGGQNGERPSVTGSAEGAESTRINPGDSPVPPRDLRDGGPGIAGPPPVSLEPAELDLGELSKNVVIEATSTLTNTGRVPLHIVASRTSCGCTAVDLSNQTLQPGQSIPVTAEFDSRNRPGRQSETVTIIFSGYDQPVQLPIRATVLDES